MGKIGKNLGAAAGRAIGENPRLPFDEDTAETIGEFTGELVETGVGLVAERVSNQK